MKENSYGILIEKSDGLAFISGSQTINIDPDVNIQSMYFADGSYIKIDPTRSLMTRYSAKTNKQESASLGSGFSTSWDVIPQITDVMTDYYNFSNAPNDNQPPADDCYAGEIAVPCGVAGFYTFEELKTKNILSTNQNFLSSSSCSVEKYNLDNKGYNGHSSLFRCAFGSGVILFGGAIGTLAVCSRTI